MNAEPTPPEEIPTYIVEGIDRQDRETLAAIEVYAGFTVSTRILFSVAL